MSNISAEEGDVTNVISFLLNKFPESERKKIEHFESEQLSDNKLFSLSRKQIFTIILILFILLLIFLFVKFFYKGEIKLNFM